MNADISETIEDRESGF